MIANYSQIKDTRSILLGCQEHCNGSCLVNSKQWSKDHGGHTYKYAKGIENLIADYERRKKIPSRLLIEEVKRNFVRIRANLNFLEKKIIDSLLSQQSLEDLWEGNLKLIQIKENIKSQNYAEISCHQIYQIVTQTKSMQKQALNKSSLGKSSSVLKGRGGKKTDSPTRKVTSQMPIADTKNNKFTIHEGKRVSVRNSFREGLQKILGYDELSQVEIDNWVKQLGKRSSNYDHQNSLISGDFSMGSQESLGEQSRVSSCQSYNVSEEAKQKEIFQHQQKALLRKEQHLVNDSRSIPEQSQMSVTVYSQLTQSEQQQEQPFEANYSTIIEVKDENGEDDYSNFLFDQSGMVDEDQINNEELNIQIQEAEYRKKRLSKQEQGRMKRIMALQHWKSDDRPQKTLQHTQRSTNSSSIPFRKKQSEFETTFKRKPEMEVFSSDPFSKKPFIELTEKERFEKLSSYIPEGMSPEQAEHQAIEQSKRDFLGQNSPQESNLIPSEEQQSMQYRHLSELIELREDFEITGTAFVTKIKVIQMLQVFEVFYNKARFINMKFIGSDHTGSAVFYLSYSQKIKPGMWLRLKNCRVINFEGSYEIKTHNKFSEEILDLRRLQSLEVKNTPILSEAKKLPNNRWIYEIYYKYQITIGKCIQALNSERNKLERVNFLNNISKNLVVSVMRKIGNLTFIVGDYSGTAVLQVDQKHMSPSHVSDPKRLTILEGDTLRISWLGFKTMARRHLHSQDFEILTSHQKCRIQNWRNQRISFVQDSIPSTSSVHPSNPMLY